MLGCKGWYDCKFYSLTTVVRYKFSVIDASSSFHKSVSSSAHPVWCYKSKGKKKLIIKCQETCQNFHLLGSRLVCDRFGITFTASNNCSVNNPLTPKSDHLIMKRLLIINKTNSPYLYCRKWIENSISKTYILLLGYKRSVLKLNSKGPTWWAWV